VFPQIVERYPQQRIIGGLKTYGLPGCAPYSMEEYDFASAAGWLEIAGDLTTVSTITRSKIVATDNETALRPFHDYGARIDPRALYRALTPLEKNGLSPWWWLPRYMDDGHARYEDAKRITAAVMRIPGARNIVGYYGFGPLSRQMLRNRMPYRYMMRDFGRRALLEMLYVSHDGIWGTDEPGYHGPTYMPVDAWILAIYNRSRGIDTVIECDRSAIICAAAAAAIVGHDRAQEMRSKEKSDGRHMGDR
jgi:hypothetical protein